jgi:7-cyano-7-deazaguanine synthase
MSGGLDSSTLAMKAIEDGFTILPININYGQKNEVERVAFKIIIEFFKRNFPHQVLDPIDIDLTSIMDKSLETWQKMRDSGHMEKETELEFYTPSRNLVFSVLASMLGEITAISKNLKEVRIGLGVHKHVTYKNYWDITPDFVDRLNHLFELNNCIDIKMYAPYSNSTKDQIVLDSIRLGLPYELTWTCYNPIKKINPNGTFYKPCLKCEACQERALAGEKAGILDINNYSIQK